MTTPRSTSKMVTTRFSHLGASFAALAIVLGPALAAEAGSAFKFHGRFANRGDRLDRSVPGADDPPPSGNPPPDDNPPPSCTAVDTGDRSLEIEEGTGAVSAHFHRDSACHRGLELHAAGMARGVYELCVGGTSFGTFEIDDDATEME